MLVQNFGSSLALCNICENGRRSEKLMTTIPPPYHRNSSMTNRCDFFFSLMAWRGKVKSGSMKLGVLDGCKCSIFLFSIWDLIVFHSFLSMLFCYSLFSKMLWLLKAVCMVAWGYVGDCLCPFCRSGMKSRDHLFSEYSFSHRIWKEILSLCLISNPKK